MAKLELTELEQMIEDIRRMPQRSVQPLPEESRYLNISRLRFAKETHAVLNTDKSALTSQVREIASRGKHQN